MGNNNFFNNIEYADDYAANRRNSRPWLLVMCVFFLACLAAMEIVSHAGKTVDPLTGHSAIESYFKANVTALVIVVICAAVLAVVAIKTFKGKDSPMMQVIAIFGSAIVIIFSGFSFTRSLINIKKDLDGTKTTEKSSYVLCTGDRNGSTAYFIAFADSGEYPLLQIPESVYDELSSVSVSENAEGDPVYDLVKESGYDDAVLCDADVEVSYYFNSAIFESAELSGS